MLTNNTVDENSPAGTLIGTAIASDPDPGAVITYAFIAGGDAGGRFVIDPLTGDITVAAGAVLDYEDDRSHVVIVRATDEQASRSTAASSST